MAIDKTAFKIPKVAQDFSQVHGMFTFDIPDAIFHVHEKINGTVFSRSTTAAAVYTTSVDGEMVCEAGPNSGDITIVHTRRHPRLHPNRGLIVSPSAFVDSYLLPNAEVEYGVFNINDETMAILDGVTVAYRNNQIFARLYSLGVLKYNIQIDPAEISRLDGRGTGFNPAEGHLLDVQGQWRGVGNWVWYLSSPEDGESHPIHVFDALNDLDRLSVSNPAMHAGFIARNLGDRGKIRAGCVDVSSEGGGDDILIPYQIGNDADVSAPGGGKVLLAIRVPEMFKGRFNSRDLQLQAVLASAEGRSKIRVYQYSHDATRLTKGAGVPLVDADWTPIGNGSCLEFIDNSVAGGLITGFNDTDLRPIAAFPIPANDAFAFNFPDLARSPRWAVHGDYIVFEGYGTNTNMSAYFYYGELI